MSYAFLNKHRYREKSTNIGQLALYAQVRRKAFSYFASVSPRSMIYRNKDAIGRAIVVEYVYTYVPLFLCLLLHINVIVNAWKLSSLTAGFFILCAYFNSWGPRIAMSLAVSMSRSFSICVFNILFLIIINRVYAIAIFNGWPDEKIVREDNITSRLNLADIWSSPRSYRQSVMLRFLNYFPRS